MKNILFLLVLCLGAGREHAQRDTITFRRTFLGTTYRYQGDLLSTRKLTRLIANDAEAMAMLNKAKTNQAVATVLSCAAGYLIGYEVGRTIGGGGNMRPGFVAASVVCFGIAVPLGNQAGRQVGRSVRIFNSKRGGRTPIYRW